MARLAANCETARLPFPERPLTFSAMLERGTVLRGFRISRSDGNVFAGWLALIGVGAGFTPPRIEHVVENPGYGRSIASR